VKQKTSKAKPRPSTLSNSLTVKAGPTGMQKVIKQCLLRHTVISCVTESFAFEMLALPRVALLFF